MSKGNSAELEIVLAMHRMKHSGIWGIGVVTHLYRFDNEKLKLK